MSILTLGNVSSLQNTGVNHLLAYKTLKIATKAYQDYMASRMKEINTLMSSVSEMAGKLSDIIIEPLTRSVNPNTDDNVQVIPGDALLAAVINGTASYVDKEITKTIDRALASQYLQDYCGYTSDQIQLLQEKVNIVAHTSQTINDEVVQVDVICQATQAQIVAGLVNIDNDINEGLSNIEAIVDETTSEVLEYDPRDVLSSVADTIEQSQFAHAVTTAFNKAGPTAEVKLDELNATFTALGYQLGDTTASFCENLRPSMTWAEAYQIALNLINPTNYSDSRVDNSAYAYAWNSEAFSGANAILLGTDKIFSEIASFFEGIQFSLDLGAFFSAVGEALFNLLKWFINKAFGYLNIDYELMDEATVPALDVPTAIIRNIPITEMYQTYTALGKLINPINASFQSGRPNADLYHAESSALSPYFPGRSFNVDTVGEIKPLIYRSGRSAESYTSNFVERFSLRCPTGHSIIIPVTAGFAVIVNNDGNSCSIFYFTTNRVDAVKPLITGSAFGDICALRCQAEEDTFIKSIHLSSDIPAVLESNSDALKWAKDVIMLPAQGVTRPIEIIYGGPLSTAYRIIGGGDPDYFIADDSSNPFYFKPFHFDVGTVFSDLGVSPGLLIQNGYTREVEWESVQPLFSEESVPSDWLLSGSPTPTQLKTLFTSLEAGWWSDLVYLVTDYLVDLCAPSSLWFQYYYRYITDASINSYGYARFNYSDDTQSIPVSIQDRAQLGFLPYLADTEVVGVIHAQTDAERAEEGMRAILTVIVAAAAISAVKYGIKIKKKLSYSAARAEALRRKAEAAFTRHPNSPSAYKALKKATRKANRLSKFNKLVGSTGFSSIMDTISTSDSSFDYSDLTLDTLLGDSAKSEAVVERAIRASRDTIIESVSEDLTNRSIATKDDLNSLENAVERVSILITG